MTAAPTQVMKAERRNIELVVKALRGNALALEKGQRPDVAPLETAVVTISRFTRHEDSLAAWLLCLQPSSRGCKP